MEQHLVDRQCARTQGRRASLGIRSRDGVRTKEAEMAGAPEPVAMGGAPDVPFDPVDRAPDVPVNGNELGGRVKETLGSSVGGVKETVGRLSGDVGAGGQVDASSWPLWRERCTLGGIVQPRLDTKWKTFFGFSEFFYTGFDLLNLTGLYNSHEFLARARVLQIYSHSHSNPFFRWNFT